MNPGAYRSAAVERYCIASVKLAEQQIADLKKEKELLAVTLAQHGADIPKTTNSTAEKDLEKARLEIAGLKEKLATHKKTDADREIAIAGGQVRLVDPAPVAVGPKWLVAFARFALPFRVPLLDRLPPGWRKRKAPFVPLGADQRLARGRG